MEYLIALPNENNLNWVCCRMELSGTKRNVWSADGATTFWWNIQLVS